MSIFQKLQFYAFPFEFTKYNLKYALNSNLNIVRAVKASIPVKAVKPLDETSIPPAKAAASETRISLSKLVLILLPTNKALKLALDFEFL